jgi:hypothetical protein
MADTTQSDTSAAPDMAEVLEKAFDQDKPTYYANIFYLSGTQRDLRISFGTLKPIRHEKTDLKVDKFDCSILLTHELAEELVSGITELLARKLCHRRLSLLVG